jgi:hypothetical protein
MTAFPPLRNMAFEMLISPQTCTSFAEVLCINAADQLKVEPTGQVTSSTWVPSDKTQEPGKLH